MNKRQKKQRAKRRANEWASEKVLDALLYGKRESGVLRHGNSVTFFDLYKKVETDDTKTST